MWDAWFSPQIVYSNIELLWIINKIVVERVPQNVDSFPTVYREQQESNSYKSLVRIWTTSCFLDQQGGRRLSEVEKRQLIKKLGSIQRQAEVAKS